MTDLTDALKRWDSERSEDVIRRTNSTSEDVELFVKAARRVADLDEDEIAFVILQAVTLDDDAVRENPMMLHDAAKAVMALFTPPGDTE